MLWWQKCLHHITFCQTVGTLFRISRNQIESTIRAFSSKESKHLAREQLMFWLGV
jgi:hypothetical protein